MDFLNHFLYYWGDVTVGGVFFSPPRMPEVFNNVSRNPTVHHAVVASLVTNCRPSVDGSKALAGKVSSTPDKSDHEMGAGGVAGIVFSLTFAVLLAMCVYYVLNTPQSNANRANIVQPIA
ncbi:hypothetical protein F3Y22_tig00000477pilonHSYRG00197 [Hibiscus syriacus]|uniref:Uncharacterized protein n=1 Tax=Hibiscus syriacus TaxID=106335 RepID=A0A6A3D716_HIBSY|nr:hypothetical protein F3Y22_tig00000477pilonHSYRG00197 [Hibiscus syriacus]